MMDKVLAFIKSGLLEAYVLGMTTAEEATQVEYMASIHPEIQRHLEVFARDLEQQAIALAIEPPAEVKSRIFETIAEEEVTTNRKPDIQPPLLHKGSDISEYNKWLDDPANTLPAHAGNMYALTIGNYEGVSTSIVWVKDYLPDEVHETEKEQFLVVEGSCKLMLEDVPYFLSKGDFFQIPMRKTHGAVVTSYVRCKVILQRMAP
jgi:mannose-6-phosphate isomerase-like protein (cupin superfamily)